MIVAFHLDKKTSRRNLILSCQVYWPPRRKAFQSNVLRPIAWGFGLNLPMFLPSGETRLKMTVWYSGPMNWSLV